MVGARARVLSFIGKLGNSPDDRASCARLSSRRIVSLSAQALSRDQEEKARKVEQGRVLYELHDTVKQGVHGISLSLRGALDAERRGEHDAARRMLERALEVSQEAEYRVSQPYDELQTIHGEVASNPSDYLLHRLKRFEEYFG